MKVTLTDYTKNPIEAIERAAANCYNTDIQSPNYHKGAIMRECIKSGHLSVTEFATFTFHIEGVSRVLTHQLVRHRMASFAQRSQRYVKENQFDYIIPPKISNNAKALEKYQMLMQKTQTIYDELIDLGIPAEDARMVLPNSCETIIEISMNLRELMHICNERLCNRAQWEIRQLVSLMAAEVEKVVPELSNYLVPKCEINIDFPICPESKGCGRHKTYKVMTNQYHQS